eukprot:403337847
MKSLQAQKLLKNWVGTLLVNPQTKSPTQLYTQFQNIQSMLIKQQHFNIHNNNMNNLLQFQRQYFARNTKVNYRGENNTQSQDSNNRTIDLSQSKDGSYAAKQQIKMRIDDDEATFFEVYSNKKSGGKFQQKQTQQYSSSRSAQDIQDNDDDSMAERKRLRLSKFQQTKDQVIQDGKNLEGSQQQESFSIQDEEEDELKNQDRDLEYQHLMMNMALAEADMSEDKTFADLVLELQDDPEDMFLLVRTIAMALVEEPDALNKKFLRLYKDVDQVLKYALKKEKIDPEDLSLIHLYIHRYPVDKSTIQYALLRTQQNLNKLKLIDIGYAINTAVLFEEDERNLEIFAKKVQSHIILTNPKLLKGSNLDGVIEIMLGFHQLDSKNSELWNKLETLLLNELKKKRNPLQKEQCLVLFMVMSKKRISNEALWEHLIRDTQFFLETKNLILGEIMFQPDYFEELSKYIVEMGYDEEDYTKQLGLNKSSKLILWLLTVNKNTKQTHFLVHVDEFINKNLKHFSIKQLMRLQDAIIGVEKFKVEGEEEESPIKQQKQKSQYDEEPTLTLVRNRLRQLQDKEVSRQPLGRKPMSTNKKVKMMLMKEYMANKRIGEDNEKRFGEGEGYEDEDTKASDRAALRKLGLNDNEIDNMLGQAEDDDVNAQNNPDEDDEREDIYGMNNDSDEEDDEEDGDDEEQYQVEDENSNQNIEADDLKRFFNRKK